MGHSEGLAAFESKFYFEGQTELLRITQTSVGNKGGW